MILLPDQSFRGAYTPLLTPFSEGRVDYGAFASFVDWQIRQGARGLVVGGTTGEPMALTITERKDLLRIAVDIARARVPVVAATGAASVADTLSLTEHASALGAAASLVPPPIYAKPTMRGLLDYYLRVADITTRPFMLYQIPSRINCKVPVETCQAIADVAPHFIGMKQSDNDRDFVRQMIEIVGPDFRVFMGTSEIAWDMVGQDACGLIVPLSNIMPGTISRLCELAVSGELEEAQQIHNDISSLNTLAFVESNPIAVKYMAWRMGLIPNLEYRLPLGMPLEDLADSIDAALAGLHLLS